MKREEILSGLRRHHRMHLSIDPTCSHAPDCAGCIIFDNARSALTRESAPTARPNPAVSRGTPASPLNEPFNTPMIGKRNVVATHRVAPEPAPCPHRELLRELREHASDTLCEKCEECGSSELRRRIDAALSQPCAAPGEPSQEDFDGMQRWLDDALRRCRDDDHERLKYLHADVRILAAARRWVARAAPGGAGELARLEALLLERSPTCLRCGRKTGAVRYQTPEGGATCLDCHDNSAPGEAGEWALIINSVGQVTYNVRLERGWTYELRADGVYRRRAPEPHPAPQPSSELPDPCATCGHDAMGHEGPWLREPPHRGQCWEKGCPCTVYRRAPEREGGDPDVR